jgi:hypothetical protein
LQHGDDDIHPPARRRRGIEVSGPLTAPDEGYMVFIVQMKYNLGDATDVPGEVQDYMEFRTYRRFMAEHRNLTTAIVP